MSRDNKIGCLATLAIWLVPPLLIIGYFVYSFYTYEEKPTAYEQKIEDAIHADVVDAEEVYSSNYRDDVTLEKIAKIQVLVDDLGEGESKRQYNGILTHARYYIINIRGEEIGE